MEDSLRKHGREGNDNPKTRFYLLRQILNLIFIFGAIAGMAVYFFHDQTIGTVIILSSMIFKFAECVFRLIK